MPEGINEEVVNEEPVKSHVIKTCGEFWNPEFVKWASPWRLLGKRQPKGPDINVWRERGVYVLYKDYAPVYVGKADRQSIGDRLCEHRGDWKKGARWDSFSWYGLVGLGTDNTISQRAEKAYQLSSGELMAALEALLIAVIDPRLNSRREWLKGLVWLYQSETDRPVELEARLDTIEHKLDQLMKGHGSI